MTHNQIPNFDKLVTLAKQDPKRLDALKRDITEAWIEQAPVEYQRRLRGIQFQIDMEVQRAKNPMDACIRVSKRAPVTKSRMKALRRCAQRRSCPLVTNTLPLLDCSQAGSGRASHLYLNTLYSDCHGCFFWHIFTPHLFGTFL
jgi:hypothetical protein